MPFDLVDDTLALLLFIRVFGLTGAVTGSTFLLIERPVGALRKPNGVDFESPSCFCYGLLSFRTSLLNGRDPSLFLLWGDLNGLAWLPNL